MHAVRNVVFYQYTSKMHKNKQAHQTAHYPRTFGIKSYSQIACLARPKRILFIADSFTVLRGRSIEHTQHEHGTQMIGEGGWQRNGAQSSPGQVSTLGCQCKMTLLAAPKSSLNRLFGQGCRAQLATL